MNISTNKAIKALSLESGIPAKTIERWLWPGKTTLKNEGNTLKNEGGIKTPEDIIEEQLNIEILHSL